MGVVLDNHRKFARVISEQAGEADSELSPNEKKHTKILRIARRRTGVLVLWALFDSGRGVGPVCSAGDNELPEEILLRLYGG